MSGDREHLEGGLSDAPETEAEPKILDTFSWVDEKGIRGEEGLTYDGVVKYVQERDREGVKAVEMDKRRDRVERGLRQNDLTKEPDMVEFDKSLNEPDKLATFVLTIDGEVAAHVFGGKDPNRSNTVEFYTVTTMKKYRGNGFMPRLLKAAEREAEDVFGADTIRLSTQEENEDAVPFYPKVEYVWEGERAKRPGEWKGKSPYWSIIFVKHLKKTINQREPVDIKKDLELLKKLTEKIQNEFPDLNFTHTRLIKEGLDNAVVILDEKIVFRFPWTENYVKAFGQEVELLEKLHNKLPLPIPHYEYLSANKDFGGYEMIQGSDLTPEAFETLPETVKAKIAKQLGEFLSAFHKLSPDLVANKPWRDPAFFMKRWFAKRRAIVANGIEPSLLEKLDGFYEEFAKLEAPADALINGDIHGRHALLAQNKSEISGVIDFGEASVGDRAYDFFTFRKYGEEFLGQVLQNYSLEHDDFVNRSRWYFVRVLVDEMMRKIQKDQDISQSVSVIEEQLTQLKK